MKIENQIQQHFQRLDQQEISQLASKFQNDHILIFDDFLPATILAQLIAEAKSLLSEQAKRRELIVYESGNTPRAYTSVGRDSIAKYGQIIPALFKSEAIRHYLSLIAGEQLSRVPYQPEEYIVNSQSAPGDTHGWHWDDYGYAFIYVLEAPDPLLGGRVEYVPRVQWRKTETEAWLRELLSEQKTLSTHIQAGQCYLMKTDTTLHRVAPLTGQTTRTVAIFTYASPSDLVSDSITHHSMEDIYPDEAKHVNVLTESAA